MTNLEKQGLYRIRKKAIKTIEDLAFLANNLPESQLRQIFTSTNLYPLFQAIFHNPVADERRIGKIILDLVSGVLGDRDFVLGFVHDEARRVIGDSENPIELVEALFFASMYREDGLDRKQ